MLPPSTSRAAHASSGLLLTASRRHTASTSAAQLARSTAAEARALAPAPLALDLGDTSSDDDVKPALVFSPHTSDVEPGSDDPDRESTRAARAQAARRSAAAQQQARGAGADDPQSEMRRLRAEAAARRAQQIRVVEVLDTDEEERAAEAERARLAAGPQLVRAVPALAPDKGKGKAVGGKGKEKGKGMGKAATKGKGRRLVETDTEEEAIRGLEVAKRRKKAGNGRALSDDVDGEPLRNDKDKGKVKENEALFKPASDGGNDDDADSLPDLDALLQRSRPRASAPPRARTQPGPSSQLDPRAQRRSRTSGRSAAAFVNDTDDEREAEKWGAGEVIATGGSGAGTFRLRGNGGGGQRLGGGADAAEESSADEGAASPPTPRRRRRGRRERSASDSPRAGPAPAAPAADDYSHLGIAPFVDPRAALTKRKKRELSSPPTSAFSSSDGDDAAKERVGRGGAKKGKGGDEFADLDKRMRRKKRQYRDERRPGYSNPRRN